MIEPSLISKNKKAFDIFKIKSQPHNYVVGDKDNLHDLVNFHLLIGVQDNNYNLPSNSPVPSPRKIKGISQSKYALNLGTSSDEENDINDSLSDNLGPLIIDKEKENNISKDEEKAKIQFKRKQSLISTTEFLNSIYLKGTKSDEVGENCPYVYSNSKFHPFSFMTGHRKYGFNKNGKLIIPSPTFLEPEEWMKKPNLSKEAILEGMIISDEGGLILVDKEMKKKFRGIISDLLAQLIKVAFGHKISLNVKLFEPKSFLQRISDYWSFLPKYLHPAASTEITPLERMKLVIAFGVSGMYIPTKQLKPFNPLIIETFQGEYDDEQKTQVYLEQISNYPTLSRFLVRDSLIQMSGYLDMSVETESFGSKINVNFKGYNLIEFKEAKEKIMYMMPTAKVLNACKENGRCAFFENVMMFFDIKNKLKGIVRFGKNSKCVHEFEGRILKFDYPAGWKFNYDEEKKFGMKIKFNKDKYQYLSTISGSWLKNLLFDGKEYWNIDKDIPYWIKPIKNCLPSDGRFREDLIWLYRSFYCAKDEKERLKYESLAQEWKLLIEKLQREEREAKAKKKKWREKHGIK